MPKFPRTLFVYDDASASTLYRLVMPAEALANAGYPVAHGASTSLPDIVVRQYELVVVSRVGTGVNQALAAIEGLHAAGIRVAIDYDDDLLHLPPHNPAYGVDIEELKAVLRAADGVIVTNAALASSLRPYAKQIAIVPNYVPVKRWPTPQPREGITVGLVGSPSHVEDWRSVAEPMRAIRERYPDVRFLVAGFLPPYLQNVATEYVEWVDIGRYPALVNRIDIGLCPLQDDQFNRCKTPIKAYEYAMGGAAVVASPTQYGSVVRGKGSIARTEADWFAAIERYIVDTEKRRRDADALRRYVLTLDITRHVKELARAYAELGR
jgi:glycosyltransferase involved in cell wall biosynthesis